MTDLAATVEQALTLWGLDGAGYTLVAARENHVYRVDHPAGRHALRLHRPGYRSDGELVSELDWLAALGQAGLAVPHPVASTSGALLHIVGAHQVDLISWLNGAPLGATGTPLTLPDRPGTFRRIGQGMARLHQVSDAWARPATFTRVAWNRDGLLGDTPLWGRFWHNPTLTAHQRDTLTTFRTAADTYLHAQETTLDYGLIHADLVRENILIDGDRVQMIDFDDGGFGFRLFDIATALFRNLAEPDYPVLKSALLDGYRALRPLDTAALDLFLALRSVTYVGWIAQRMTEPGAPARNARFVQSAVAHTGAWLSAQD